MDAKQQLIQGQKLEPENFEREKLGLKRKQLMWTTISIVFTVSIACATLAYNAWSVRKTAQSQFAIKVADIIFSSDKAGLGLGKARAIDELFSDELPPSFARRVRDKEFLDRYMAHFSRPNEYLDSKKELLKLIVEHPKEEKEILDKWERMFPWEKTWLDEYRNSAH